MPGDHGFEPPSRPRPSRPTGLLVEHCPHPASLARNAGDPLHPARAGELVLDCIMLAPDQWWVGYHRAKSVPSRYPGGMMSLELPPDAVSRAWLKMEEALRWSQLPIPRGARVAEIGSAPGGASQALLARGLIVTGIDPAEMAPAVLNHPHFTHIRRRSTQVRRRDFRKIRWLTADMNVAPNYTLDAVEAIVTHPRGQHSRPAVDAQAARIGVWPSGCRSTSLASEAGATTSFGRGSFSTTAAKYAWPRCKSHFAANRSRVNNRSRNRECSADSRRKVGSRTPRRCRLTSPRGPSLQWPLFGDRSQGLRQEII